MSTLEVCLSERESYPCCLCCYLTFSPFSIFFRSFFLVFPVFKVFYFMFSHFRSLSLPVSVPVCLLVSSCLCLCLCFSHSFFDRFPSLCLTISRLSFLISFSFPFLILFPFLFLVQTKTLHPPSHSPILSIPSSSGIFQRGISDLESTTFQTTGQENKNT